MEKTKKTLNEKYSNLNDEMVERVFSEVLANEKKCKKLLDDVVGETDPKKVFLRATENYRKHRGGS